MGKYRFDEIAINSTQKKKPIEEDRFHYVGLEHIDPECFEIQQYGSEVAPVGEKLVMKKGDILFGKRRAYQRKVAIAPCDGIFSAHGMVLRPKTGVIDSSYFPFFISSDTFMETAIRISVGGLSPTINWKDLAKQEFELPSLEEQKNLADKLWAAYRLKEAYKKLLIATDEMVKSQFIEMFGYKSPNAKMSSVSTIVSGKSIPKDLEDTKGPLAYVKVADFNIDGNEKCITTSSRFVTTDNAKLSVCIPVGSVIFAKNGAASLSNKKRITVIECCIDMNTMAIIPKDNILSEFLYSIVCSIDISRYVRQGAIPSISPKSIENICFYLPPIEEQERFVCMVEQADKSKFELKQCIEHIDKVIKSLING